MFSTRVSTSLSLPISCPLFFGDYFCKLRM